jgi:hypothetical protein
MPFCHNFKSYVLEMVSIKRNIATWEKEASRATWGQEKKGEFEGEVHKNKRPLNLTQTSPKKEK